MNIKILELWKNNLDRNINKNNYKDISYIVCTSGTTGEPKYVKVGNYCIWSNVNSLRNVFNVTENDVIYAGTPLTFDPSIIELYLGLYTGATLLSVSQNITRNSAKLLKILFRKHEEHKSITVLQMVPSVFLRWPKTDIEYILQQAGLRILALGGERFPEHIMKIDRNPQLRIFNLYGITEVSCWALASELVINAEEVVLGSLLDDTEIEIRDGNGVVQSGEGELFIGSSSRLCYINEENIESIKLPLYRPTGDMVRKINNKLYYVGRNNNVIKRFGHKINLTQIEECVLKETDLYNCSLWLEKHDQLVLFVVIKDLDLTTKDKVIDKLRIKLLHVLPKQYFPDDIEIISNFPLTNHGKIDKESLKTTFMNTNEKIITNDKKPVEIFISLWCKYFGLRPDELQECKHLSFIDVGGNSILAMQLLAEFERLIHCDYPNDLANYLFEKNFEDCCNFIENCNLPNVRNKRVLNDHEVEESEENRVECLAGNIKESQKKVMLKIRWKYNLDACVDSSPIILKKGNQLLVAVGSFAHIFVILNGSNGAELIRLVLPDAVESAARVSPTHNHLYTGCYDGKMYCIDFNNGSIIWEYKTNDKIKCTPCMCLKNTAIVFGSYDKYVHCVQSTTGVNIWKTFINESITSSPVYIENLNTVYVATVSGTCMGLSETNGDIIWRYLAGSPIFGSPCVVNDTNIIWSDVRGVIHCVSNTKGEKIWVFKVNGNIYSSLIQNENCLIFGCHDHNVYFLEYTNDNCRLKNKTLLDSPILPTPSVIKSKSSVYILACSNAGYIYLINFNTGNVLTSLKLPSHIFSSPAVDDNKIFVGCRDNHLYCIEVDE